MKVKIERIDAGKKICFVFEGDSKSPEFASKETAIEEVIDLFKKDVISFEEYTALMSQIMTEKNLPHDGSIGKKAEAAVGMLAGIMVSGGKKLASKVKKNLDDLLTKKDVERFEMCQGGKMQGTIYHATGSNTGITTKKTGLAIAKILTENNIISQEGCANIQKAISESPLPDE